MCVETSRTINAKKPIFDEVILSFIEYVVNIYWNYFVNKM